MTTRALFEDLRGRIAEALPDHLPGILVQLAAAQSAVAARLITAYAMPVNPQFPTPLLNVEQIGERLQLPKSAVYELIRQGKLPAVRIGKHVRIEAGRLEQWIAEHRNGAVDNATRIPTKFRPVVRD